MLYASFDLSDVHMLLHLRAGLKICVLAVTEKAR